MKNINYLTLVACILMLTSACKQAPKSDQAVTAEPEVATTQIKGDAWPLNIAKCNIEWIGTKVSNYHSGSINIAKGNLIVNDGIVNGGNFTIDMSSMKVTGPEGSKAADNEKLLGHLMSGDFFDVEKNPEATFEITGIQPFAGTIHSDEDPRQRSISKYIVANPTHTITGNLTIKGVSKSIEFPSEIKVEGNSINAIAKFNIDRTQWNIVYPGMPDDLIRNDIHFGISITAENTLSSN